MPDVELDDKVLVYQGPLLYDSKVLKIYYPHINKVKYRDAKQNEVVETRPDSKLKEALRANKAYFVHYLGWNNKWNEWVAKERLLERSTENLLLQKNLKLRQYQVQHDAAEQKVIKEEAKQIGKGKKRSTGASGERTSSSGGGSSKRRQWQVQVPDEIKLILVQDWESVTHSEKLVSLPPKCTANKTLNDFTKKVCRDLVDNDELLDNYLEIIESMKIYFNRSLGTFLLYRVEREQYKEMMCEFDQLEFIDIYAPIFLLRLCTILPNLLLESHTDLQTMDLVKGFLEKFYTWFAKNKAKYLVEYENCMPLVPFLQ